jgi:hypothetical protein
LSTGYWGTIFNDPSGFGLSALTEKTAAVFICSLPVSNAQKIYVYFSRVIFPVREHTSVGI